ncbi:MAG: type II secretion system F family protein [Pirellulales bacterium]
MAFHPVAALHYGMLLVARIGTKDLAGLSRRLSTALEAGLDLRSVLTREVNGPGRKRFRAAMRQVAASVDRGAKLGESLDETGDFFPALFREMVDVGDETGRLPDVLRQLAEHYDDQLKLRRIFLAAIAWPVIEFVAALGIVGFLIWILGVIGSRTGGKPIDVLGLGLVGNRGLTIYCGILAGAAVAVSMLVEAGRRGWFWPRWVQRGMLRIPVLGRTLRTLAEARLAWTLHLTMHTGMEVQHALRLSLQSARNAAYTDQADGVARAIAAGREIHEALGETGVLRPEFIEALAVGEQSGRVSESMAILARQARDQARNAIVVLTTLAGFAVWALVAIMIIVLIFRLFSFYVGTINDALKW